MTSNVQYVVRTSDSSVGTSCVPLSRRHATQLDRMFQTSSDLVTSFEKQKACLDSPIANYNPQIWIYDMHAWLDFSNHWLITYTYV